MRFLTATFVCLSLMFMFFSQKTFAETNYTRFLELYQGLLQTYVTPVSKNKITYNGVDYTAWANDPQHTNALKILRSQDPLNYTEQGKKAFWINTYNFLTIELIIRKKEQQSIKNLGSLFKTPWQKYQWSLTGGDYTLDYIEHKILRKLGDPRIHFAINCASLSCPDLRREPYTASSLNTQLEEQVTLTLTNPTKGLRLTSEAIYLNKIFDWFSEDFSTGDVKGWLQNYIPDFKNQKIQYMDYNWDLNKQ